MTTPPDVAYIIEVVSEPANVIEVMTDAMTVLQVETAGPRGLPGPAGPPGQGGTLSTFRGVWNDFTAYVANDSVIWDGVYYLSDGTSAIGIAPSEDQGLTTSTGWFKISVAPQNGEPGTDGLSAYQLWLNAGNTGTIADFLTSLKGADGQDGTGGTGTYTNLTPTPTALGGVAAGTTFDNWPVQQVFDTMFYPYLKPAFSSFGISGQSTNVEVGSPVGGAKTFTWQSTNDSNVFPSSLTITEGASTLALGLPSDGSTVVTLPVVTRATPGSRTFAIRGTDTHSTSYVSSFTINWVWRLYYGTSANTTLIENQIEALAGNQLGGSGAITYSFGTGGYKYICYPDSFPAASVILDNVSGLTSTFAGPTEDPAYNNGTGAFKYALVTLTNSLGASTVYKVYRTKYVLNGAVQLRIT